MIEGVKLASPSADKKKITKIKILFWLQSIFKIIAITLNQRRPKPDILFVLRLLLHLIVHFHIG